MLDKERNAPSDRGAQEGHADRNAAHPCQEGAGLSLFTSVFIHAYSKKLDGLYFYPNGRTT